MFINRSKSIGIGTNKSTKGCLRCSILRMFFSAVFLLIVVGVIGGDKVSYLSFVTKETGAYLVLFIGLLIALYRVLEWYFIYRNPKIKR